MADFHPRLIDPKIIAKAADVLDSRSRHLAVAVLEAVADDLRAEGFEHALDEVSASYTIPTPDNPYRKES